VRKLITALSSVSLLFALAAPVTAAPPAGKGENGHGRDNLPGKLAQKQAQLKAKAQAMVLKGEAKPVGKNQVVQVANGQYVELALEGEDQILTLLAEFGDGDVTHNHGGTIGNVTHTGDAWPHNNIPEPDRDVDNTTIWEEDFSQAYFDDLLYNKNRVPSMANYYLEQSGGRYSVDGMVGNWVQVPNNPSAYGSNYCGSIVCTRDIGRFLVDQANAWYASLVADGMSAGEIDAMLAEFDIWDRYDHDGDGDFDEPDGYIDHFQSVHAGEGEETGGGELGEDAIWSHRSYANAGFPAPLGPVVDGEVVPFGGLPIGGSKYWIGDYTIEPENGGVGVFAHEFAHDKNIPDLYDTSGNTGGADNSTAWWTIMSQGSYGSVNGEDLGSSPTDFGAWEKFQLGFTRPGEYAVGFTGQNRSFKLGPAEDHTKHFRNLFVILPDKEVTIDVGDPWSGSWFYHSGSGNDLDNTMTKAVTLPAGAATVSFDARYHIEPCWDYAYLQVSTDGGATFTNVHTSASDAPDLNVNGQNFGEGISGVSGHTLACDDNLNLDPAVVNVTADLGAYAGQTVQLRFRYWTDGAAIGEGLGWDNLRVNGALVDDAETDTGWTFAGFVRTDGTVTSLFFNAYVAEYRQYRDYDEALDLGPYNFVDPLGVSELFNYVEHFSYQDGLLINYWDTSFGDNSVGDHPGGGLLLPVDAHPDILTWSDGSVARARIQSYDSTFGFSATEPLSLHNISPAGTANDLTLSAPSLPGNPVFNDLNDYWVSGHPGDAPNNGQYQAEWASVNVPKTGTQIRVVNVSAQGTFMLVEVR
jgi:immune inhibitor A